jgi:hypothetical protein
MDQLDYQRPSGALPNINAMVAVDGSIHNPAVPYANNVPGASNSMYPIPNTNSIHTGIAPLSPIPPGPLNMVIDFSKPDAQRTRPLSIDNKKLYVDEHYISVWSPILRSWFTECPDRELILANVQYDHVLEMLQAIHPTYKDVDDQSVHILLPLAFDYQVR